MKFQINDCHDNYTFSILLKETNKKKSVYSGVYFHLLVFSTFFENSGIC